MDISIFLAKALGIYLVIISIGMLVHAKIFRKIINDIINNQALLFLSGVIALVLGILLVLSHNIWQNDWRVVITVVAWLAFIKGITRIILPTFFVRKMGKIIKNNTFYYATSITNLLIGIFLCYHGFA